jgi:NMT1/THI5 like
MKARWLALLGGALWACLPAPASAQELFVKSLGDVKVGDVAAGDKLAVPYLTWGGDVATFHANGGLTTADGSIFGRSGLKLALTPGDDFLKQVKDYLEGRTPFLRGTLGMIALASEVLTADARTEPVVFLQLTWSNGDHLVARGSVKTPADLKGKKIALQHHGPHVTFLDDVLRSARLGWKDVSVVWTDDLTGPSGPAALFRREPGIDACFTITPEMQGLTGGLKSRGTGAEGTVKDAFVLASTADMNRSIADVYVCRKDFFTAQRALVEKFTAGYLKGCEELVELRAKAARDKDAAAKYKALLQLTCKVYGTSVVPNEADADGMIADVVFPGLPGNVRFFTDKANPGSIVARGNAALELALSQGYVKSRTALRSADFDYEMLKKLGGLTAPLRE